MTDKTLLLLVLIILILGVLFLWPYSGSWRRPTVQDDVHDLQSAGRNVADSIRGAVQQ